MRWQFLPLHCKVCRRKVRCWQAHRFACCQAIILSAMLQNLRVSQSLPRPYLSSERNTSAASDMRYLSLSMPFIKQNAAHALHCGPDLEHYSDLLIRLREASMLCKPQGQQKCWIVSKRTHRQYHVQGTRYRDYKSCGSAGRLCNNARWCQDSSGFAASERRTARICDRHYDTMSVHEEPGCTLAVQHPD